MCYNPQPNALVFAPTDLTSPEMGAFGDRFKRRMRKVGRKLKKARKILKPIAAVAGPVLMATGVGAPLGAAITAGTTAATIAKKARKGVQTVRKGVRTVKAAKNTIREVKKGNPIGAATRLATELVNGGDWMNQVERLAMRDNPKFRKAMLTHLAQQAQRGNTTAQTAIAKLAGR